MFYSLVNKTLVSVKLILKIATTEALIVPPILPFSLWLLANHLAFQKYVKNLVMYAMRSEVICPLKFISTKKKCNINDGLKRPSQITVL